MTTSTRLKYAEEIIARGMSAFPLKSNSKDPARRGWQAQAKERDPAPWANGRDRNIGVATGGKLVVVDIDMKGGVDGEANWAALGIEESDFQVRTPSGGRHIYYVVPEDWAGKVRNSASKIAKGVDIRGEGGYVVGPGSEIDGTLYEVINKGAKIGRAPKELLALLKKKDVRHRRDVEVDVELDKPEAIEQAREYLSASAPESIEGAGGNSTAYSVACRVRDMGVSEGECLDQMLDEWNSRCAPPWEAKDLGVVVRNAYRYAEKEAGSETPEAQFADEPDSAEPVRRTIKAKTSGNSRVDQLNEHYALVAMGSKHAVLENYVDEAGKLQVATYGEATFLRMTVGLQYVDSEGVLRHPGKEWLVSPHRRTYRGLTFDPSGVGPVDGKFNLWRGFTYEPLEGVTLRQAKKKCSRFLRHILEVVCQGDRKLYKWLLNYFADLIQRPDRKPETAIVLIGDKGTGKSLTFDVIGNLVRENYVQTADKRMMLGNFNSHMENVLVFLLEEAFWAGDKGAEGKLKHLITGKNQIIERKGYEPYSVANYARILITSNEDWAIPATSGERRFAVIKVGNQRAGDKEYFNDLYAQLEGNDNEGFRALMTVLSSINVDKMAVDVPPRTRALAEQKIETFNDVEAWLHASLSEGQILQTGYVPDEHEEWPEEISCKDLYEAYRSHAKSRYPKKQASFGRTLSKILRSSCERTKARSGRTTQNVYRFSGLDSCRQDFERWFGDKLDW